VPIEWHLADLLRPIEDEDEDAYAAEIDAAIEAGEDPFEDLALEGLE